MAFTMSEFVATPSATIALIFVLTSTISDMRTVKSSSVLAASCPTDGLMLTGGTGRALLNMCDKCANGGGQ